MPGDAGYAPPAPEPTPEPAEATVDPDLARVQADPAGALEVIRQSAEHEQAVAEHQRSLLISDAVRRYEEGEEDPDVIADELRDRYGYDVAVQFAQHWQADDAQWEDPPASPETAAEWAEREYRVQTYLQQQAEAEQAQQATEQQAALNVEIQKAFTQGVLATRDRHAALSRGRGRSGVTSEGLFQIVNQLGADVNPRTPDEARLVGEQLYRQAVELTRSMNDADLVTSLESPTDRALRANYMPGAAEREESRNALSLDDERLNRFVRGVDATRTTPRPTLAESVAADLDGDGRSQLIADQFNFSDGHTRTELKKLGNQYQPGPQTVADGWNV